MRAEQGMGHVLVILVVVVLAIAAAYAVSEREQHPVRRALPPVDPAVVTSATKGAVVALEATMRDGRATGTGVLLTAGGEIVASYHVVEGASAVHARLDGRVYAAHVVGFDATDDVALLQL